MFTKAALLAMADALVKPVLAYLSTNAARIAVKGTPPLAFLVTFGLEWATGSVWARAQLLAVVLSAAVLALEVCGHLNVTIPPAPPSPKPAA